jgi:hypothetical protein
MIRYAFLLIFAFFIFAGCKDSATIHYYNGDIRDAFRLAGKEHKKVFVLITNNNCGSCKGFDERLKQQPETLALLAKDYVCYRADVHDSAQRLIAEIVKCPGSPFPYFFDAQGDLLAFGFPNKEDFDISNLDSIGYSEYSFKEAFQLPITVNAYKRLVSLNMRATLLADSSAQKRAATKQLLEESLDIAAYPYNIRFLNLLSTTYDSQFVNGIAGYSPSRYDERLYGDLHKYMLLHADSKCFPKQEREEISGILEKAKLDLGLLLKKDTTYVFTFRVTNPKETALELISVRHSCDCIQLEWPKDPILPGQMGVITARFTPYESGEFIRDIYVHSSFKEKPMQIFSVTGSVID